MAEPKLRLLSISANPDDHSSLDRMIDHQAWQLATARTCRSAFSLLEQDFEVVIADGLLPDGTWRDILTHTVHMDRPPKLIVTSRLADAYLWSEVLNLGGFDVLAKPFLESEVQQVLASITRHRGQPGRRTRTAGGM
jgi:DNA-binding response OmpR family regulator